MDEVQKPSNAKYNTPSLEPFRTGLSLYTLSIVTFWKVDSSIFRNNKKKEDKERAGPPV
jgi:hypothetical protein